jgi:hypothetical protein
MGLIKKAKKHKTTSALYIVVSQINLYFHKDHGMNIFQTEDGSFFRYN